LIIVSGTLYVDPAQRDAFPASHEELLAYRAGDGPPLDDSVPVTAADVELHHVSRSEPP
jgi:hypothetical protein